MQIYPFSLEFDQCGTGQPYFASFPFIMDGSPVKDVSCGISSVFAGSMKAAGENPRRLSLFDKIGVKAGSVYGLHQTHSRAVLHVGGSCPPEGPADGMVCGDRQIALSVTAADCLPVYFYDTKSGCFGLVHSGWKGTGIALQAVKMMGDIFGSRPKDIAAALGPCIGSCCYAVDALRAAEFEKEFGSCSVRREGGKVFLDLKTANIRILKNEGVGDIAVCNACTFCDSRLGSFRREGPDKYTLMAAVLRHLT